MNIQSTRAQALTRPSAKKEAYQAAQKKANEASEAIWDKFSERQDYGQALANKVVFGVGIATAAVAGIAVLATGQLSAASTDTAVKMGLSCLAIGGAVGVGAGGAVFAYQQSVGQKETQEVSVPAARKAIEELSSAREDFRNEMLSKLDDEGVVKATEEQWALGKQGEADAGVGHRFAKATQPLATMLGDMEALSVARQRDGWVENLARDEDNPAAFREQLDMAIKHPNLAEKLQPCEG